MRRWATSRRETWGRFFIDRDGLFYWCLGLREVQGVVFLGWFGRWQKDRLTTLLSQYYTLTTLQ